MLISNSKEGSTTSLPLEDDGPVFINAFIIKGETPLKKGNARPQSVEDCQ